MGFSLFGQGVRTGHRNGSVACTMLLAPSKNRAIPDRVFLMSVRRLERFPFLVIGALLFYFARPLHTREMTKGSLFTSPSDIENNRLFIHVFEGKLKRISWTNGILTQS